MPHYEVRYVHKISPSHKDSSVRELHVELLPSMTCKEVGSVLRSVGILNAGDSVREYRVETDGRIVAFPRAGNGRCVWHSIVMRKLESPETLYEVHTGEPDPVHGFDQKDPYGYARDRTLQEFIERNGKPLCVDSAPRTLTFVEILKDEQGFRCGTRVVGQWFVPAGVEWQKEG